jgi:hypothetical protein
MFKRIDCKVNNICLIPFTLNYESNMLNCEQGLRATIENKLGTK